MSITDQRFLGHISESMDEDQSDLNEALLFESDRIDLIVSISNRISEPFLKFLLDKTDKDDIEYWGIILTELSSVYSLTYAKIYKNFILSKTEFIKDIIHSLLYIKINLINLIEQGKINKNITRDEFEEFLSKSNSSKLIKECIKYIDSESYTKFIHRLFYEVTLDFME